MLFMLAVSDLCNFRVGGFDTRECHPRSGRVPEGRTSRAGPTAHKLLLDPPYGPSCRPLVKAAAE